MSFCWTILHFPGCMIKDVGSRMVQLSHEWTKRRKIYPVLRHQNVRVYKTIKPMTEEASFIAPNASIVGNVIFGTESSAMYHVSIRNYHSTIPTKIGDGTCILENVSFIGQVTVGSNCVIGIGTTLDCCTLHENVVLGSGVNICLGCKIEQGAIIASGSTVKQDTRVPANELWAGNPAQKICDVTEEQRATANALLAKHIKLGKQHRAAIEAHYAESKVYDRDWLLQICEKVDAQQKSVAFAEDIPLPVEARFFLQPRVSARLPHMHARVSYPINRIAPHLPRMPDWTGNS